MTARAHRSELAVPGIQQRFLAKATASPADVIFLDLEDAVAASAKETARGMVIEALNTLDWGRRTMAVRVNALGTLWALRDIVDIARACPRLDLILLPKAESAFDVQFVAELLASVERETGRERPIGIEVLLESAKGISRADEIAAAHPRLEAMVFGVGDYSADLRTPDTVFGRPNPDYTVLTDADAAGQRHLHYNDQWHYALARVVNACRANNLRPIDGPYTDYKDPDGFHSSALRARSMGFEGKWAIHPTQVEPANAVFSPTPAQVTWAREVVSALDAAAASGQGAVGVGGVLVDLAHVRRAREVLTRAALIEGVQGTNP
ncbi:CoA ester lyase [Acidisphaera sp. L21]|uniref:HpcH/HpaI aldolase/citrate lyase family protein n=1 Tax=Acidisphaera sp. L21 TaxID=1641851 RepID=UPI00131E8ACB|nr:CoA ester lyase [Acidisphaera sp. L21]